MVAQDNSSSSIVISFSIVILLVLILLLLLSYNSRNKNMHDIERFEEESSNTFNEGFYNDKDIEHFKNLHKEEQFADSVASHDTYTKTSELLKQNFANVNPASDSISTFSGVNGEYFESGPKSTGPANLYTDPTSCLRKETITSQDLLPKDAQKLKWANVNPSSTGNITDQNFLTAGYHVGVNTVGQSLRNANLQLRSEIPNPQVAVSPWMISTIEPDIRPTTLEIGSNPTF